MVGGAIGAIGVTPRQQQAHSGNEILNCVVHTTDLQLLPQFYGHLDGIITEQCVDKISYL